MLNLIFKHDIHLSCFYGIIKKTKRGQRLKHCNLSTIPKKGAKTQAPKKAGFSNKARCDTLYVALGVTR